MSTPQTQPHTQIDTKNGSSDEEFYQSFTSLLLSSPNNDSSSSSSTNCTDNNAQDFQRHYHISSLNTDVIIRQIPSQGLSFKLWPAAITLCTLLDTPLFRHKLLPCHPHKLRILELGSGTGLVGITAAAILGADVTVTDLPGVIPNLEYNVAANAGVISASGGTVVAAELTWGNSDQMEAVGRKYDVIVGSDVVYHDHLYEPLLETLKYFLVKEDEDEDEKEVVFLMAHLKRWKKEKVFFKKAKKMFKVDEIHREDPDDGKRVGVIVYRFVP